MRLDGTLLSGRHLTGSQVINASNRMRSLSNSASTSPATTEPSSSIPPSASAKAASSHSAQAQSTLADQQAGPSTSTSMTVPQIHAPQGGGGAVTPLSQSDDEGSAEGGQYFTAEESGRESAAGTHAGGGASLTSLTPDPPARVEEDGADGVRRVDMAGREPSHTAEVVVPPDGRTPATSPASRPEPERQASAESATSDGKSGLRGIMGRLRF